MRQCICLGCRVENMQQLERGCREGQLLWMGICVSWNLGEFSTVAVINNCHVVGEQER